MPQTVLYEKLCEIFVYVSYSKLPRVETFCAKRQQKSAHQIYFRSYHVRVFHNLSRPINNASSNTSDNVGWRWKLTRENGVIFVASYFICFSCIYSAAIARSISLSLSLFLPQIDASKPAAPFDTGCCQETNQKFNTSSLREI